MAWGRGMARAMKGMKAGNGGCCAESACMCLNLRRAARAVTQLYDEAFRDSGIRATQLTILGPMAVMGPLTITNLAELTVTDRTTLTRNLRLLERRGLVAMERGEDRREHRLAITVQGQAMLKKTYPMWERVQVRIERRIGRARMERLLADLSAVVEAAKGR